MIWLIASVLVAISNVFVMMAYAEGKFGRTPLYLPFLVGVVSLCCAVVSFVIAGKCRKAKDQRFLIYVLSGLVWLGLMVFNFISLKDILYVS